MNWITRTALKSLILFTVMLSACSGIQAPEGIQPVQGFELNRYLGTWYEIARLDHSFERGMDQVSAQYSLRDDGGVRVLNRGYRTAKQTWSEAEGKAYFVQNPQTAHLKVSFFGPFYGAYVVFDLDPDYQVSMVAGPNRDYLWILSRTPQLPQAQLQRLIAKAKAAGFSTEQLIFPQQASQ